MDKSGALAYIYAKASGSISKSFVESRISKLFEPKSLADLWTLIFKTPAPLMPETLLAQEIEKEAFRRFIDQYIDFISCFDKPDDFLQDQFFIYEVENLKEIGAALCSGEKDCPDLVELRDYTTLHTDKWPDIKAITAGTEYAWYNKVPGKHEQQEMEFKLDLQAYRHIWDSIHTVHDETREGLIDFFTESFIIKNTIWALRLKLYYNLPKEEIIPKLIVVTDNKPSMDPIAGPVLRLLDKDVDKYDDWSDWKYSQFLNPYVAGNLWQIDPLWIEKKSKIYQNKKAVTLFHSYPLTSTSIVAWYKIKQFELGCIRTAVEALRLNVSPQDAMNVVGAGEIHG